MIDTEQTATTVGAVVTQSEPGSPAAGSQGGRIVEFVEPIPGFADERTFSLAPLDEDAVLFVLRSLRTPRLRFVVMPPAPFFPDYHPAVDAQDVAALGELGGAEIGDGEPEVELQVLVIVSVTDSITDATANLLAPIVLDPASGRAMQVVLADARLPLRAPLFASAS